MTEAHDSEDRNPDRVQHGLFAAAHVGIVTSSLDGRVRFVNPAAAELLGFDDVTSMVDEVNAAGGAATLHVDRQQRREFLAALGREPGGSARMTARLRRADGSTFLADISSSVVRRTEAAGVELITFLQDVTQQRELELEVRRAHKMEAVGRLAAAVAEDFGTLLHGILERAQDLAGLPEPHGEAAQEISAAAVRALELVRKLLAVSQHEAMEPRELDLDDLAAAAVRQFERTAGARVAVRLRRGGETWRVYADPRQIDQVLGCLLANALDALPGEGTIEVSTANRVIDDAAWAAGSWVRPGRYATISVRDDGCGIPPEARDHVYEPFFTTKGFGRGSGLGLAAAYAIMKQHQGFLSFESELDRGSTFTLHLPALSSAAGEAREDARPSEAPAGRGELILVADDDDLVRHLAQKTLTRAGYEVLAARDGEQALELFMTHAAEVRLLVLDVVMPRMDGRALYENISELRADVPVLFFSGYRANVLESEYMLPHGGEFCEKPFRVDDLLQRVRRILDRQPSA